MARVKDGGGEYPVTVQGSIDTTSAELLAEVCSTDQRSESWVVRTALNAYLADWLEAKIEKTGANA